MSTVKKISIVAFVLFLVLPITELIVIFAVGDQIGFPVTIALLIAESLFGAWIVSREGGRAWRALKDALGSGQMPSGELADGALVLVGGALLLTPGFITDFVGFFFVVPFTRPIARRVLQKVISAQLLGATRADGSIHTSAFSYTPHDSSGFGHDSTTEPGQPKPRVVDGELLDTDTEYPKRMS